MDEAGIDMILVGDSMGNVIHGYGNTIPVSLDEIKKIKALANMALVRLGRLSVQPVTPDEFEIVTKMGSAPS